MGVNIPGDFKVDIKVCMNNSVSHGDDLFPGNKAILFLDIGSLIFAVKEAAYWGVSARTRAHTPICGCLSREFLKNLDIF
jgi:hypothetical protein